MDYVTVMEVNIPLRGNHSCTACLPPITTKCCFLKLETENVLLFCQVCGTFKKNSNFCLYYGAKIKICESCQKFFRRWAPGGPPTDVKIKRWNRCLKAGMSPALVGRRRKNKVKTKSAKFIPQYLDNATIKEVLAMSHQN